MAVDPDIVGLAYVGIGVLSLGFLDPVYRYWGKPGSTGFGVIVGAIALWSVGMGSVYIVGGLTVTTTVYSVRLLAAQLAAIGSVLLALEFIGRRLHVRRVVAPLVGYLVVVQALVLTNGAHGLVFRIEGVSGASLAVAYGPVFWVHLAVAYGLVVLAIGLLFGEFVSSAGARRRQSITLAFALLIPLFLNVGSNFGAIPTAYDLTPVGFFVSAVVYTWALYGTGFLSVVPVARRTAIEAMDDAYVTLDRENVVVDVNDTARSIFDLEDPVSTSVEDVFADHRTLVSYLTSETSAQTELSIERDGETYHFHVTVTPLWDAGGYSGNVLVMRDITSLKRREQELRQREAELNHLQQVFARVLRHDLRNSLCVVKGHGGTIARDADAPFDEMGAAIAAESDRLEEIAGKTTTIARLVNDRETVTYDLVARVHEVVDAISERYPEAAIEVSAPSSAPIRSSSGLEPALWNLLENAVEHSGDEPTVRIDVRSAGAETVLEIVDDGPGIPDQEIEVLREGRETALEHGSGIGLWLVDWVVAHSDGDLTFESTAEGTTVTIRFRTAAVESKSS